MQIAYAIIAALVLMGLGGFLIKQYGSAKLDVGALECKAEQADTAAVSALDAVSKREGTENANRKKKDDTITAELRAAGWLRDRQDR